MSRTRRHWITSCSAALLFGLMLGPFTVADDAPTSAAEGRAGASSDASEPSAPRVEPAVEKKSQPRADRLAVFRGLGAWVDYYDLNRNIDRDVRRMASAGVRTLYIQTGRTNTRHAIDPRVGPWLQAAQERGMQVVGWYLPYYRNVHFDARRAIAIKDYRYRGHRFDALGIDIEVKTGLTNAVWNRNVVRVNQLVRSAVGDQYPVAAIPPTPLQMRVAPAMWAGFPWMELSKTSDAMVLMSYWTDRIGCPQVRRHCPYEFTARNVKITRRLVQKGTLVHIIGGVGDRMSDASLTAFIRAAQDVKADGASLYDVPTTRGHWWEPLSRLRKLGDR